MAVNRLEFSYGLEYPNLPPLEELGNLTIQSTRDGNVFRAPAASGAEDLALNGLPEGCRFDSGALRSIAQEVVRWYNARGLNGVWVEYTGLVPSDSGVVDNRPADNQAAQLVVWVTQIPPDDEIKPQPVDTPIAGEVSAPEKDSAQKLDETGAPSPVAAQEADEVNPPAASAAPIADTADAPQPVASLTPEEAGPLPTVANQKPDETSAPTAAAPVPEEVNPPMAVAAPIPDESNVRSPAAIQNTEVASAPVTDTTPMPDTAGPLPPIADQKPDETGIPTLAAPIQEEVKTPTPVEAQIPDLTITPAPQQVSAPADPGVAVERFEFSYGLAHPDLPPLEELKNLTIQSTRDGNVYRSPAAGGAENLALSGLPEGSRFDGGALRGIAQDVVRWYNSRGLYGVWVTYTNLESTATGVADYRPADNQAAQLVIWASQISYVRTLARGQRIKTQYSINHRKHSRIISRSPLKPGVSIDAPGSLFRQDVLNEYVHGLSLHPGRRVEASIASAGEPGKVVLDYLVNESRSWQIFSQVNNYGTEQTGQYRARLGFQHNQLTNHDDILNVDLISTPDFKTYGSFLSYRIPLWRPAKLLFRIYGSYGDFVATDNSSVVELRYVGKNWLGGGELTNRLTLWRDWTMLSALGVNFNHYGIQQVISDNPLSTGTSNFLVPFISTTLSRNFPWGSLSGGLRFDHTVGDFANQHPTTGIPALGRRGADAAWTSARWNLNGTVYLEPLFNRSDKALTLAHEVSVRLKGRVLLRGKRLIPHEQEPLGGALSIRGYPEAILSADEFVAATVEYAYHIPRGLKPAEEGTLFRRPFKWRPKQVGQNPDWDLVLRAFFDYAYRGVNPAPLAAGQEKEPVIPYIDRSFIIAGAGVGVAFMVKQNFSLRCDYGMALTELKDDNRLENDKVILAKGNKQIYLVTSFSW